MISSSIMLLSSSYIVDEPTIFGYCKSELKNFLPPKARLLFMPFAYPGHDKYTSLVRDGLADIGVAVTGGHTIRLRDAKELQKEYDGVFCGGGNTFLLLAELYDRGLMDVIRTAVMGGLRYIGSSAGANVACPTIGTTNDMPIVQPQSHAGLSLIPFNINPHYFEWPKGFRAMSETRKDRIKEFMTHNNVPVVAMREGAILSIDKGKASIIGKRGAIIFRPSEEPAGFSELEVEPGESLAFLFGGK